MYKIAIVDHVGNKSGMDIYDTSLATELAKSSEVYIYSNFDTLHASNSTIYHKKVFYKKKIKESIADKILYFFSGFTRAFIDAKRKKIDVVIVHSFSYEIKDVLIFILARLLGLKMFLIAHDISGFAKNDNSIFKRLILENLVNKILVHNNFSKRELLKEKINQNKIFSIRHGGYIDYVTKTSKIKACNSLGLASDCNHILFFGQIKEVKGLDLLLKAFSIIKTEKSKLIISGKVWNDNYEKYDKLIDDLNLRDKIIFHKRFIPDTEKDLLFSAADVVVIPYREIYQSGVLLTALSYPSVVLCSNLEANKEVISNGENGFLFKSNDIQSLSSTLTSVLNENHIKIEKIKKNALETVKTDYSWSYAAKEILKNIN